MTSKAKISEAKSKKKPLKINRDKNRFEQQYLLDRRVMIQVQQHAFYIELCKTIQCFLGKTIWVFTKNNAGIALRYKILSLRQKVWIHPIHDKDYEMHKFSKLKIFSMLHSVFWVGCVVTRIQGSKAQFKGKDVFRKAKPT